MIWDEHSQAHHCHDMSETGAAHLVFPRPGSLVWLKAVRRVWRRQLTARRACVENAIERRVRESVGEATLSRPGGSCLLAEGLDILTHRPPCTLETHFTSWYSAAGPAVSRCRLNILICLIGC